ncbi:hypothetical protein SAMN05216388_101772 [Halorientalis persicus]|uniref:Uncharacterized protein n=1 Tax=Halorientalis persicus TaxID=1367881 RepID=A0A1H8RXS4_9EURY|nr:hypothetical protein [Halorientalis persicus]SEO71097.1 hypothetical protein SAMN05216388_101772 [Halorientalis persicus]
MSNDAPTRTKEATLADGESITVDAKTDTADRVATLVDDGDGNEPATYDLVQEVRNSEGDWMPFDSVSSTTETAFVDEAVPRRMRATVTNVSGGEATFRAAMNAR